MREKKRGDAIWWVGETVCEIIIGESITSMKDRKMMRDNLAGGLKGGISERCVDELKGCK